MKERVIKHLKLSTGEEIICEVTDWDEDVIMVRGALKLVELDRDDSNSVMVFRPLMTWIHDVNSEITLNPFTVVATHTPDVLLMAQYEEGIHQLTKFQEGEDIKKTFKVVADSDSPPSNIVPLRPPE